LSHEFYCGILNISDASLHAGADVQQKHDAEGHLFGAERSDLLLNTILVEREVARTELRDIAA